MPVVLHHVIRELPPLHLCPCDCKEGAVWLADSMSMLTEWTWAICCMLDDEPDQSEQIHQCTQVFVIFRRRHTKVHMHRMDLMGKQQNSTST